MARESDEAGELAFTWRFSREMGKCEKVSSDDGSKKGSQSGFTEGSLARKEDKLNIYLRSIQSFSIASVLTSLLIGSMRWIGENKVWIWWPKWLSTTLHRKWCFNCDQIKRKPNHHYCEEKGASHHIHKLHERWRKDYKALHWRTTKFILQGERYHIRKATTSALRLFLCNMQDLLISTLERQRQNLASRSVLMKAHFMHVRRPKLHPRMPRHENKAIALRKIHRTRRILDVILFHVR